ncbi:MAG: hypothetical protein QOF89_3507 [Acidobacteriota bacterium]|jgi:hypothetical protein|nr:hypothetical protein [Acidobacteriota bacterium]
MKTTRTLLLALILGGALAGTASAQTSISAGIHIGPSGRASVDLGFFYDDLAPYGNWVQRPQYGWVWTPRVEQSSWRPYEDGHWAWTDEGWTWISDEPYGWATYHYGRWYDDPDYGWEWIPGDEWAPAWVSWQESDDYVGWAPLPPSVDFRPGVNLNVRLSPDAYVFVPSRQFLAPRVRDYVVSRAQYGQIFPRTRNVTRYNRVNNRIFNQGVAIERIQRVTGRQVTRYQIADLGANDRHRGARIVQNRVTIFRPQVQNVRVAPPPDRPAARRAVVAQRQQVRTQRQEVQVNRQQQTRQRVQVERQRAQNQQWQAQAAQQRAQRQQRQAEVHQQRAENQQRQAQAHQQRAQGHQQRAQAQRQKANQGNHGNNGNGHGNHRQKPPKQ